MGINSTRKNKIFIIIISLYIIIIATLCVFFALKNRNNSSNGDIEAIKPNEKGVFWDVEYKIHSNLSPAEINKKIIMMEYSRDYGDDPEYINFRKISEAKAEELAKQIAKDCSDNYTIAYAEYNDGPPTIDNGKAANWVYFGDESKRYDSYGRIVTYVIDGEFFVDASGCKKEKLFYD